jgi:DNA-binding MarR family transcriptional regulator
MAILEREYRRLLTYSRFGSLSQLFFFDKDGVPYRDLKSELGLGDSHFGPQIKLLKDEGYVEAKEQTLNNEKLTVYYITNKGKQAYSMILEWIKTLPIKDILLKENTG